MYDQRMENSDWKFSAILKNVCENFKDNGQGMGHYDWRFCVFSRYLNEKLKKKNLIKIL